jgi:hypothetical protein
LIAIASCKSRYEKITKIPPHIAKQIAAAYTKLTGHQNHRKAFKAANVAGLKKQTIDLNKHIANQRQ